MSTEYAEGVVRAVCPGCKGSRSTFMPRDSGSEFGSVIVNRGHTAPSGRQFGRAIYQLLKCGGCGRGALATIYCDAAVHEGDLVDFFPFAQETAPLPAAAPDDITKEFREAELCAAVGANRAASALFRSALEKTLSANGYCSGNLKSLIDTAAGDGLITESRRARAHEDVRALGNDVLHEAWQAITREQVSLAHRFAQRIIEDFYDDRPTAEKVLLAKGRITS